MGPGPDTELSAMLAGKEKGRRPIMSERRIIAPVVENLPPIVAAVDAVKDHSTGSFAGATGHAKDIIRTKGNRQ